MFNCKHYRKFNCRKDYRKRFNIYQLPVWICDRQAVEKWILYATLDCVAVRRVRDQLGWVLLRAASHQVSWKANPSSPSQAALITELRGYEWLRWDAFGGGGSRQRNSFDHWCGSEKEKSGNKASTECLIWKSYKRWQGENCYSTWHICKALKKNSVNVLKGFLIHVWQKNGSR